VDTLVNSKSNQNNKKVFALVNTGNILVLQHNLPHSGEKEINQKFAIFSTNLSWLLLAKYQQTSQTPK
jgi:hypothetical protein